MKRLLKWIGIVLGGLVGLLALAAVVLYALGTAQLNKTRDIQAEAITIPTDEASLRRGEHLVAVALCTTCHGQDLAGDIEFDDPTIGKVYAANITGLGTTHSDAALVGEIRHGVETDGRELALMPANVFINFSAEDLGELIAYLKTVPRTGNDLPEPGLTFMGRILLATGTFGDVFPAEVIDHNQPFPAMPEIGANVEYGAYLSFLCSDCHGKELGGQLVDPTEPNSPWAPNLTPGGELNDWSEADFIQTMRSGVTPDGDQLDPEWMPWEGFAKFDDAELNGLWMYLQSLPAVSNSEDSQ